MPPKDQGGETQIRLPWRWEERSGPEQHMLLAMGFAGKALSAIRLQRPGRSWLGLGLGVGLATGALVVAALRPFVSATGTPAVAHGEDKPEPVAERITPLTQGQYRITVATPKWLEQTTAPAGAQVKVTWPFINQPCVDQVKGAEIWRCAAASAPERLSPGLIRSLAVLVALPTEATPLALALLNSGTADIVLIDPAWPRYSEVLLGPALDLDALEQLLIIGQDTHPSRAIKNTPGQRSVWLSAGDWPALVAAMKFTGQRKLTEVWPKARVLAGNPEPIALKGLCPPQDYIDEQGMAFVRLCPGTFLMGSPETEEGHRSSEGPQHQVTLSTSDIGKYEVTNAQYQRFKPDHSEHDNRPVVSVRWDEAKAFCEHYGYRLPTEAEWEYAARAGTQTRWSFGNDESQLEHYAWYSKNSNSEAHPVGTREPNSWGLYDMHGNVWEWVADWYGDYTGGGQTDPTGPTGPDKGQYRVLRGGAFVSGPRDLRSASRGWNWPEDRYGDFGFRCARAPRRQP